MDILNMYIFDNTNEIMIVFISLGLLLLLLSLIVGIAMIVGFVSRWPSHVFVCLMQLILVAQIIRILLSGRVLGLDEEGNFDSFYSDVSDSFLGKLLLIMVIGTSVAMCLAWFVNIRIRNSVVGRFTGRGFNAPNDIIIAFIVYFVSFSIFPIFFGQDYYFHINLIYPIFVYLGLLLWVQYSYTDPVITTKQCLFAIVFGSLVAAVIAPDIAMQPGYLGLIPGFSLRLLGITDSCNSLGSVAVTLLVIEVAEPTKKSWLRVGILLVSSLSLILTQSKTSIIAAIGGIFIIVSWRLLTYVFSKNNVNKNRILAPLIFISFVTFAIAMIDAWIMFFDTSIFAGLENKLNASAVGDITTATGRTLIWKNAIKGGFYNPLFGQGGGFWSIENIHRTGLTGAVHAHNLFLQAFSQSGMVGLLALLAFLWFLVCYSFRAAKVTRGGSVALMSVFLIRAMFEVPLQPNAILGAEFFASVALFFYVIDRGAKQIQKVPMFDSNSMGVIKQVPSNVEIRHVR